MHCERVMFGTHLLHSGIHFAHCFIQLAQGGLESAEAHCVQVNMQQSSRQLESHTDVGCTVAIVALRARISPPARRCSGRWLVAI